MVANYDLHIILKIFDVDFPVHQILLSLDLQTDGQTR